MRNETYTCDNPVCVNAHVEWPGQDRDPPVGWWNVRGSHAGDFATADTWEKLLMIRDVTVYACSADCIVPALEAKEQEMRDQYRR